MAKRSEWEIIGDFVTTTDIYKLEPFKNWESNFMFWLSHYIKSKCELQSKRFVSENDLSKVLTVEEEIGKTKNIEKMSDLVNQLSIYKFKSIKTYFNNIYPLFYFLKERDAYSIKNITTNLLIAYFSMTKEKEDTLKGKIKEISIKKNVKKIYELSYDSKINRLTIMLNFIKFIEDSNIDNDSDGAFLFNLNRKDITRQIKKEKRVLSVLTPKGSFQEFFNAIDKVPFKENVKVRNVLMLKILMYLGLRVSELVYLKIDDVTIDKDKIKFNIIGKGNKQRILYILYENIKKDLHAYERIRKCSLDNYFFTTNKGTRVDERYINTIINETLKFAQIEVTKMSSPHMIRHSTASYLKHTLNMEVASIAKWLGHEDIRTTMRYLHYTEQEIIDMANKFERID